MLLYVESKTFEVKVTTKDRLRNRAERIVPFDFGVCILEVSHLYLQILQKSQTEGPVARRRFLHFETGVPAEFYRDLQLPRGLPPRPRAEF